MKITVRLLGNTSIEIGCEPVVIPTRKAVAALAILAVRPGVNVPRSRLCDMLWPRSPAPQARTSLRQTLAQLRRELAGSGDEAIEATGDAIRLRAEAVESDAALLEAALARGNADELLTAAELYRGDLLQDFVLDEEPFEEWRRAEAAHLRARTMQALGRLLQERVEAGDCETALALGEKLLALDPANEETHQALLRLHIARGSLGSAVRQYERCREALKTELGVVPSAVTEELRRQIRPPRPQPEIRTLDGAKPSLAVLPFTNLSDDPEQAWFARSFAEDLTRELSRFRPLHVVSASSVLAVADPQLPMAEIGERLGVRYLLTGSVRRGGTTLRVAAELVEAQTRRHVWAQRHDVPLGQLLEMEDGIVAAVAAALAERVDGEMLRSARVKAPADLQAYECWLRGMERLYRATAEDEAEARALFERALELDPQFARAEAGLSLVHFNDWSCLAWDRWHERERSAYAHACRAVALDDADAIAHMILGRILLYRREYARAEHHFERAESLNPNDAGTIVQAAFGQTCLGCSERGRALAKRAMQLNPFHAEWYFLFAGVSAFYAREMEEAVAYITKSADFAVDGRAYLASGLAHLGRLKEARAYHADFMTWFGRHIGGGRPVEPEEAERWVIHVNPLRREEDRDFLIRGLRRAAGMS